MQLYVSPDPSTPCRVSRPKKELKGFAKVFLEQGEAKEVSIPLDKFATVFYDEVRGKWVSEEGTYKVLVGKSSADIVLVGDLEVEETVAWSGL